MAAIPRQRVSQAAVILGGVLTLLWGGALIWLAFRWLLRAVAGVGSLFWP